jgi:hypothetical protein
MPMKLTQLALAGLEEEEKNIQRKPQRYQDNFIF